MFRSKTYFDKIGLALFWRLMKVLVFEAVPPFGGKFIASAVRAFRDEFISAPAFDVFDSSIVVRNVYELSTTERCNLVPFVEEADIVILAFPVWCEMPPAIMVEVIQRIFTVENVSRFKVKPKIKMFMSAGRIDAPLMPDSLISAFEYLGLETTAYIATGIVPGASPEHIEVNLNMFKGVAKTLLNGE